jgi:putative flippase GtrA
MADGGRQGPVPGLYPRTPLSPLLAEWMRFVLVGGINTAFGYGVYAAGIYAGAGYAVASAISMIAGVLFNYYTTGGLVFRGASSASLLRFTVCYAVVYLFSVALLAQMDAAGIDPYLAGILVGMPAALLSYLLLKLLVFRRKASS